MTLTLQTYFIIIFSLIFGYIFYNVFVSENFGDSGRSSRSGRSGRRKRKSKKTPATPPPEVPVIPPPEVPVIPPSEVPATPPQQVVPISSTPQEVWGINDTNNIVYKKSFQCLESDTNKCVWDKVETPVSFSKVYQGQDDIWAITNADTKNDYNSNIYICPKPCKEKTDWKPVVGQLSDIYITKDYIYGINKDNNYYQCSNTMSAPCDGQTTGRTFTSTNDDDLKTKINTQKNSMSMITAVIPTPMPTNITVQPNSYNYLPETRRFTI